MYRCAACCRAAWTPPPSPRSPLRDLLDAQRVHTLLDSPIGAVSLDAQRCATELVLTLHDWIAETDARLDLSS
jgi:hypothetical protein